VLNFLVGEEFEDKWNVVRIEKELSEVFELENIWKGVSTMCSKKK
jgi:hypothetical protein